MKAGEPTEKEAEAMMVTFRKEAGARDKNGTDYRAFAKRLKEALPQRMEQRGLQK